MHPKLSILHTNYNEINKTVTFYGPKIIGFFSSDGSKIPEMNTSKLKYINNITSREVNFDLHLGYEQTIVKYYDRDLRLNNLLAFLLSQEATLSFKQNFSLKDSIFFCIRGLLNSLAQTPYDNCMPRRIIATLFKGDIYLCMLLTEKKIKENYTQTINGIRSKSYGHKFEQFMVSDYPNSDPNPNSIMNENDGFFLIHEAKIDNHTVVYASEVDAIACDDHTKVMPFMDMDFQSIVKYLNEQEFIELKTSGYIDSQKTIHNFQRYKSLGWWIQSYLSGVEAILCGFKNNNRYVKRVEKITVSDLIKKSKMWHPQICLKFLDEFFTYVKRSFEKEIELKHPGTTDLPLITLHFERKLVDGDISNVVEVTNNYDPEKDSILPEYFIKQFRK